MTLAGNIALYACFGSVLAFFAMHVRTQFEKSRYGRYTMENTLVFLVILIWLQLYPWFGINVREHPNWRFLFWLALLGFFIRRLTLFIRAQRGHREFESMSGRSRENIALAAIEKRRARREQIEEAEDALRLLQLGQQLRAAEAEEKQA